VFVAVMQILVFFALVFLLRNLLPHRQKSNPLLALAGTAGFFVQYVMDINAWSNLAGLSLGPVLVGTVLGLANSLTPASSASSHPDLPAPDRLATFAAMVGGGLAIAIAAVPLAYVYPEMFGYLLAPVALGGTLPFLVRREWVGFGRACLLGLIGLVVTAIACLIDWKDSLGALVRQASAAFGVAVDWYTFHDRYLFDASVSDPRYHGLYAIFAWPVDFMSGLLGLFFLRPPANIFGVAGGLWRLLLYVGLIAILWAIGETIRCSMLQKAKPSLLGYYMFVGIAGLAAVTVYLEGFYWTAGKMAAMMGPFTFVAVLLPLGLANLRARLVTGALGLRGRAPRFRRHARAGGEQAGRYSFQVPALPRRASSKPEGSHRMGYPGCAHRLGIMPDGRRGCG
jgi:hypothetical protein